MQTHTVYIFNLILVTHGIYDVFGKKMFINWTADGLGFLCCINCGQFLMSPKDFYFFKCLGRLASEVHSTDVKLTGLETILALIIIQGT